MKGFWYFIGQVILFVVTFPIFLVFVAYKGVRK